MRGISPMKPVFSCALPLVALGFVSLVSPPLSAADPTKYKVLDSLHRADDKSLKAGGGGSKLKAVSTSDSAHPKVLEFTADFRDPSGWAGFTKTFPEGSVSAKKHTGFRFFVRGESGTRFNINVTYPNRRSDMKSRAFQGAGWTVSDKWTEVVVPFSSLKRHEVKEWKDGKQLFIPGGDAPEDEEINDFTTFSWSVHVSQRGSSVNSHMQLDDLSLILK
ncbi:MAG: hypothetical protein RLZZ142_2280 [Verrucomicrobiota bacterium]|jgi:hypothetical protein